MELRSCTHLHYIQAAKGGLLVKTLSSFRGRPALKLKKLTDIYESLGLKYEKLILLSEDESEDLLLDSERVKAERPVMCTAEESVIKSDPDAYEFSFIAGGDGANNAMDDHSFGDMTLKQLKQMCKVKKRKHSTHVDISSETNVISSLVKKEYCKLFETDKDDSDLLEPLISWKSKLSKKVKTKSKCSKKRVFAPSQSASSVIRSEEILSHQDFAHSKGDLPTTINVKIEIPEPDCSDFQNNASLIPDDQSSGSSGLVPVEVTEVSAACVFKMQEDDPQLNVSETEEEVSNIAVKCVTQTQEEDDLPTTINVKIEVPEPDCSDFQNNTSPDNQSSDSSGLVLVEVTEVAAECVFEMQEEDPQLSVSETEEKVSEIAAECVTETREEDIQPCVTNEACYKYMDCCNFEHIVNSSDRNIEDVDDPEITSHFLSASESKEVEYVGPPIYDDDLFQEPICLINDHISDVHNASQIFSYNHEMECQNDSDPNLQVPELTTHKLLQLECSGSDACSTDNDSKDELPSNQETSALNSSVDNCGLSASCSLVSSADDSLVAEEKKTQWSAGDAESNCFLEILQHDASGELTTSVDAGFHYSESGHAPERLFPTRKTISPASQEKLCKAMESFELRDEEHYGGKKKLCFGKQIEDKTKIHNVEVPDRVRRIRFSIKPKHIVMKPKNDKRHSRPKIPKAPHISQAVPHISTECSSLQSCSQSAIAFSERQMHDIECLATKLMDDLKTMREIAEESMWSEAYPSAPLKYDVNQVRVAIKNASKVEQSAKRWLSIMARDCSRFCKIMRISEKGSGSSDASESVTSKERKRIVFADEAGEKLCHVRVFESDLTTSLESDSEKQKC